MKSTEALCCSKARFRAAIKLSMMFMFKLNRLLWVSVWLASTKL